MWVIKIGGQLADDPALIEWLDEVSGLGGGRVVLVPGEGDLSRHSRRMRNSWNIEDLTTHNIVVLGMGQFAFMMQALRPEFALCAREQDILDTLHAGRIAIWLPLAQLRQSAHASSREHSSADSLALWLAERLNAEKLVLIKSPPLPADADWQALADAGVVDAPFAQAASMANMPVTVLDSAARASFHEMLIETPTLHRFNHPGTPD